MTSEPNKSAVIYIPKRLVVSVLTSFGLLLSTVIQTNFAITNSLILNPLDSKDISLNDSHFLSSHTDWSSVQLGYLNSIFYLGYVFSHVPAGFYVHKYSATKYVFLFFSILKRKVDFWNI